MIAFAGTTITVEDVSTVLGLVGRDLLFDLVDAIVAEDAPAAFALADRAVASGHDLRLVVRELTRVVRDLMIVSVDPSRVGDGELAEGERERLMQLASRFSREDLMRAFDLLANAEQEIRTASHPRYQFEMLLLKWMHTRKLVPLTDLLAGKSQIPNPKTQIPSTPAASAEPTVRAAIPVKTAPASTATGSRLPVPESGIAPGANLKDKLLAEIRSGKATFYNTVVAQAQRIDVNADRIAFVFGPAQSTLRQWFDQQKTWLDAAAERVAGRKIAVTSELTSATTPAGAGASNPESRIPNPNEAAEKKRDLKAEAMASSTVQAMLEVFPAEIRDVEEM